MKNKFSIAALLLPLFSTWACSANHSKSKNVSMKDSMNIASEKLDTAVLAGGCFWCLDAVYRRMKGVVDVESGYSNGSKQNPSYEDVCSGTTGHAEVVRITFDTSQTSYAEILEVFWRVHNPTTLNRQGNDIGTQYRSGIFYLNESQKTIAEASMKAAMEAKLWEGRYYTIIEAVHDYFPAEEYHQNYYANNPSNGYCVYVVGEKVAKFKKLFADKLKQE